MLKPVLCLRNVFLSLSTLSMIATGCGGVSTNSDGDQPRRGDHSAEVAKAKEDPKVAQASNRCQKEIRESELQPPDLLAPIQIHACLYAIRPQIAACSQGVKRDITLKVIIEKTGEVANAFPIGDTADCPEARCVEQAVKEVKFPKFKGLLQQVIKYPFTLGE